MAQALLESSLKSLPRIGRGKVRDIYAVGDDKMLILVSDRLSAFDVVLTDPIPDKGRVLTELANFWFAKLGHVVPNHLTGIDPEGVVQGEGDKAQVRGRSIVVKKLRPLPIEAVVRGYIIGSGWKDYQKTGAICGITLPKGLQQAEKLPEPIFTPATKAESGHDENISFERMCEIVGFGIDGKGELVLIDEVLTADSSRFWPASEYKVGVSPPSFDKQFVRDYLETLDWDKTPPAPKLPAEVIERTSAKYREALERLTKG
jgi:phosphoribosylaminoimidazole-succinocarboxamide synthase